MRRSNRRPEIVVLAAALLLCGCAPRLHERVGPVSTTVWPQAEEQCKAQPWLDWCNDHE